MSETTWRRTKKASHSMPSLVPIVTLALHGAAAPSLRRLSSSRRLTDLQANKITPVNPALASRFQSIPFAGRVTEFRR